jgi:transcriptional regulator with XRE-family HTH domain
MAARKPHRENKVFQKNIVGARVRQARKAFPDGLTQDQLSGKLAALNVQLDRAGIAKVELGIRHVFDYELLALARALKVDLKWLIGLEDGIEPSTAGRRFL